MKKNAKKRYRVRRVLTAEEKAELLVLVTTHSTWSKMADERGDCRKLAARFHVSKTIISRILKHGKGSLENMRKVARFLINRQAENAKISLEILDENS